MSDSVHADVGGAVEGASSPDAEPDIHDGVLTATQLLVIYDGT